MKAQPRCKTGRAGGRNPKPRAGTAASVCLLVLLCLSTPAGAQALTDEDLAAIRFDQNLNQAVSPGLDFQDEQGTPVRLGQYFGRRPVVLVLGYYRCPMLCTLVLNGLIESAADMKWSIGREYEIVDVSIDPKETTAVAAAKKRAYVKRYGRPGAAEGWHFLTGREAAIKQLAGQVGFHYAYDGASKEYAHPSGLVILTPDGRISRYLFGVTYSSKELYEALRDASSNRVGSVIQQLILLCFHYNPITGKYSGVIIKVVRVLSVVTMAGFLWLIVSLVRRGRAAEAALESERAESLAGSSSAARSEGQAEAAHKVTGP